MALYDVNVNLFWNYFQTCCKGFFERSRAALVWQLQLQSKRIKGEDSFCRSTLSRVSALLLKPSNKDNKQMFQCNGGANTDTRMSL